MDWVTLRYSKKQVDDAGVLLAQGGGSLEEISKALDVLNNWRAAHSFPLNTIQMNLRRLSKSVHRHPLVAQRLKRVPSMILKLQRFPKMSLYRMQDIGGCRSVVDSVTQVIDLKGSFDKSKMKHFRVNEKNYISNPKESGYRGIHLIYRFNSSLNPEHNGRQIEIQLRSKIQHAWATAVETAGTFLQQSLKSSEGEADWLRFFALSGSLFSIKEKTTLVPNTPVNEKELVKEATELAARLRLPQKLRAYGQAVKTTERLTGTDAYYFLLSIDPGEGKLTVRGYRKKELEQASEDYLSLEKSIGSNIGSQAVLVAVDSINALKRSYPNYYLDTQVFMSEYTEIVNRIKK